MSKGKRNRERRKTDEAKEADDTASAPLSFELKQGRSFKHLQDIDAVIDRWVKECLDTLREEPDPDEADYYCAWIDPAPIDLQLVSLQLGDCLQCLRSSLDHLAFELAAAFTSPLTDEFKKRSEFPIFGDERGDGAARFHAVRSKGAQAGQPTPTSGFAKIAGVDPQAQTFIEGLQPYHRRHEYETDPLWILQELNRLDKHRLLHVVRSVLEGATIFPAGGPEGPRNVAYIGRADGGESIIGAESGEIRPEGRALVGRWAMVPIDPSKKMHMGFKPVLSITFAEDTPLVGGKPVLEVLLALHKYVMTSVFDPLRPFV